MFDNKNIFKNDYFISVYIILILVTGYFIGDYFISADEQYLISLQNYGLISGSFGLFLIKLIAGILPSFFICSIVVYIFILFYSFIYGISEKNK